MFTKYGRKLPQKDYEEVCMYLLKKYGEYIRYITKKNYQLSMLDIELSKGTPLKYIEPPIIEMIKRAADIAPANLQSIKEQTPEHDMAAVERNLLGALYINKDLLDRINAEKTCGGEDDGPAHPVDTLKKLAKEEKSMALKM